MEHINTLEQIDDIYYPINNFVRLFSKIKILIDLNTSASNTPNNKEKE